jgi:transposase-like protein
MPRVSGEKRAEILRLASEENADLAAIAAEHGVNVATIERWQAQESAEPTGIAPPTVTGGKRGAKLKVKAISEETAKQMIQSIFAAAAIVDRDPVWFLNPTETKALADPLCDSLRALPAPIAEAVNTYVAPATFVTTLSVVIKAKLEQKARNKRAGLTVVPNPPKPPEQRRAAQPPNFTPEPPRQQAPQAPTDLEEALRAAKGRLTGEDEPDDATQHFGEG